MIKKIIQVMCGILLFVSAMFPACAADNVIYSDEFVRIIIDENGQLLRQESLTNFQALVVAMPDGAMPTYEQLGITDKRITNNKFSEISRFDDMYDIDDMYAFKSIGDGFIVENRKAEVSPSSYYIPYFDYMTDYEAIQLIKKLKAGKIILSGGLVGHNFIRHSSLDTSNGFVKVNIECSDALSEEYITKAERSPITGDEKYCGFVNFNNAGFTVESIFADNTGNANGMIRYSLRFDREKYKEQSTLYKAVHDVFDEIKNDNVSKIDFEWLDDFAAYYPKKGIYTIENNKGDINSDGNTDLYDLVEIAKYIVHNRTFTDEEYKAADFNNDDKVNLYDAIEIAKTLM